MHLSGVPFFMAEKLDILVITAHPDDAELCCAGTIIKHLKMGRKVGIVDLTKGELGTRGNGEIRLKEAEEASRIMGLTLRDNLGFKDMLFVNDEDHRTEVVMKIREYQPDIVLTNAVYDRHPDHAKAAELVSEACFMSGLPKFQTELQGKDQKAWKPKAVYHIIQSQFIKPDFVVDVSDEWDQKMEAIQAYRSQFHDPDSTEPETFISAPGFLKLIEGRGVEFGYIIGARYAEGFTTERYVGVNDLGDLI